MKKLLSIVFIPIMILSCVQSPKEHTTLKSDNPLSGVFTSRDSKAETLFRNMNLFAKADFSYVDELLAKDFILRTSGDTAVAATGGEETVNGGCCQLNMLYKVV